MDAARARERTASIAKMNGSIATMKKEVARLNQVKAIVADRTLTKGQKITRASMLGIAPHAIEKVQKPQALRK
jgi:hypothetical protein